MLTSKEIVLNSGISRATLNNYIKLGILPRPLVQKAVPGEGRAARLGYFPDSALDAIERVAQLKRRGFTMAEIANTFRNKSGREVSYNAPVAPAAEGPREGTSSSGGGRAAPSRGELRLTVDQIEHPVYLVNSRFEVEWCNREAETQIFGQGDGLERNIAECGLFSMFVKGKTVIEAESRDEILRFHLAIAKNRLPRTAISNMNAHIGGGGIEGILRLYDEAEPVHSRSMLNLAANLGKRGAAERWHNLYASFFREGVFFVYTPSDKDDESLLNLLARRDLVIRDILKHRRPYLTPLAILVADLQDSVKICAELPPEEYFELINSIWGAMDPMLRKYYATHGKHVGDGMVYYFFPQPDCDYVNNAIHCAYEMKLTMRELSRQWRNRKKWLNELELNIGLEEGEEWFGTYQTPTHLEFTVLGDSINRAGRLSDFATSGSIWVTKSTLGKIEPKDREKLIFGIRRQSDSGGEMLIPSTYSRISNLIDLDDPRNHKFQDIAVLTVTEIIDVLNGEDATQSL